MAGLFLISFGIIVAGITVSAIIYNTNNNYQLSFIVLMFGLCIGFTGWTLCWMYDSYDEMAARIKYEKVRKISLAEDDFAKFGIDLKTLKPIVVDVNWLCDKHTGTCGACDSHCTRSIKKYTLLLVDDDCSKLDAYEALVEKENKENK